jgi:hypothetical protein
MQIKQIWSRIGVVKFFTELLVQSFIMKYSMKCSITT